MGDILPIPEPKRSSTNPADAVGSSKISPERAIGIAKARRPRAFKLLFDCFAASREEGWAAELVQIGLELLGLSRKFLPLTHAEAGQPRNPLAALSTKEGQRECWR